MSKHNSQQRHFKKRHLQNRSRVRLQVTLSVALGITAVGSMAGDLNLSNNALEVVTAVEPNVMIINDDSGSMDWEVMSTDYSNGGRFTGTQPDGSSPAGSGSVTHKDGDDDGTANCGFGSGTFTGYLYIVEFGNNSYTDDGNDCNTADDEAWRIRNSDFNPMYFDPTKTYLPWEGVNASGTTYGNIDITNAPDDPYNPTEWIDLTQHNSNWNGGAVRVTSDRDGDGNPDGFRYYTWVDTDGDGLFDDGEETEHKIRDKDAATQQNFANWFGYYRSRDFAAKAAFSLAIKPADNVRMGYATINNNASNRIRVASLNVSPASGNKKAVLDELFKTAPSSGTPLRRSLDRTGKYYKCSGTSTDIFGSTNSVSPGNSECPVEDAPIGQCQQNYTILMTDGFWNGSDPSVGNTDDDGGAYAGGAYADTYSNTLADVAMHYYKTDLHSVDDNVPTSARDLAGYRGTTDPFETMHQHMATYTVGFGVVGTLTSSPSDVDTAFTWPNPSSGNGQKIDDLQHAAFNGRGQYLSANDPLGLATAMSNIFTDIASATGTATAVAFNTQEVESGTLVFRASFNTKTSEGDLIAQNVNADGSIDPTIIWSAADELDDKVTSNSDTRTIITYQDNGDNTSTGVPFQWASLNAAQQALLNAPQPANVLAATNTFGDERLGYLRGHNENEGINYDDGEFRERAEESGKLGDIVHSTPVFVGKPHLLNRAGGAYPSTVGHTYADFKIAYSSRNEVSYTGGNDGMLHAFDTSDGSEVFAYVPNILMGKLSDLTNPDYSHRYYVDLSPAINDAYFSPASGTNSGTLSWNTVLVGGLNAGGKGYYALNVTDPSDLDTESEAKENVMWEFTEADDGGIGSSDLGYTFSQPIITMSNADDGSGNKKWVAIFGNGYNSTSTDGDAAIYVLFLEGGQDGVWTSGSDFYKISTGNGKAESADGTTPNGIGGVRAVDTDTDGTVDYVYAGDLQGNLYRFDMTNATPSNWVSTPKTLFQAKYKASDSFTRDIIQPITTTPLVLNHPTEAGEFLVIVGTGSWMTTEDATSTDIQSIYGIWDDLSINPLVTMTSTANQLVQQTFTNHTNAEHGFTVRTLTNNEVAWDNQGNASTYVKGWYIDLDVPPASGSGVEYPGERATRNIQYRGGILFVNTVIPKDTAACSVGVGGYELALDPTNGGSGSTVIFDLDGNNDFGDGDNVGDAAGNANIVTGIQFDGGTPSDAAFIGSRRMTQVGDEIRSFDTNTGGNTSTGRTSWREVTQ